MPRKLYEGILEFKKKFAEQKDLYSALREGQFPDALFITCSDSRVVPALFTQCNAGDLFVIRNAGNIISPYNPQIPSAEAATIEFALKHLSSVSDIIVCGHAYCGAMHGLRTPHLEKELPSTAAWLCHAKEALDRVRALYPEVQNDPERELVCLTKANVLLQLEHLKTHPDVAARYAAGTLRLHGWYYDFVEGQIYVYHAEKNSFITVEDAIADLPPPVAANKHRMFSGANKAPVKEPIRHTPYYYLSALIAWLSALIEQIISFFTSKNYTAPDLYTQNPAKIILFK